MDRDNQALLISLGLGEPSTKPTKSAASLQKLNIAAKKKRLQDERAFKPELVAFKPELVEEEEKEEDTPRRKRPSLASTTASPSATGRDGSLLRRSSRSVQAIKRLADEVFAEAAEDDFDDDEGVKRKKNTGGEPQRLAKSLGKRTQNPYVLSCRLGRGSQGLMCRKQFGHIPGVEAGRTWASRMECSTDAIHA